MKLTGRMPQTGPLRRRPGTSAVGTVALCCVLGCIVAAIAVPLAPKASSQPLTAPATIDAMMEQLSRMPGLSARYREEKRIALLAVPLVDEGTIHFTPPAKLVRHCLRPERVSVLIEGSRLTMGGPSGRESVDLGSNPVLRSFVEGFVHLLAGDRAELERSNRIRYEPAADGSWRVSLEPRQRAVRHFIRYVRVCGRGLVIERLDVAETSGDESVTTFTNVDTSRRYTRAEISRIFRVPGR